jgi:hypothetical protein
MSRTALSVVLLFCLSAAQLVAQQTPPPALAANFGHASISGVITDTDHAAIPGALVSLVETGIDTVRETTTDSSGVFQFLDLPAGKYLVRVKAMHFSAWKVEDIALSAAQDLTLTPIELGVESIDSEVNAITVEDLAEQQITAEEHQRILGILPNFYVSYLPHAAPLTRRQKFKLAFTVSTDPLTFITTGVTAAIGQADGAFAGYGQGFGGYAQRYAATYGDKLSATMLGSAVFPSLFHQDPRYFYRGHGNVVVRALYAVSTTVVCKGDNGRFQPNYSNILGNLAAGGVSGLYYPATSRHGVQVTIDDSLLGIAEGGFGTLFQEFVLKHVTHGVPRSHP